MNWWGVLLWLVCPPLAVIALATIILLLNGWEIDWSWFRNRG